MGHQTHQKAIILEIPERVQPAIDLLIEAWQFAEQTNSDHWEFAVEIAQFRLIGLTPNDFRWLVRAGLAVHQREVTLEGDDGRAFRPTGDLVFPEGTCFILSDDGVSIATGTRCVKSACTSTSIGSASKPKWDADARELRLRGSIVKRYKWQAVNQETVLNAFEEENWPHRIDDPLPPQADQDSKRRLCDTIKCLNRKQTNELIRFHGDGSGEGVVWEQLERNSSEDKIA